jgi:hypothetical protein
VVNPSGIRWYVAFDVMDQLELFHFIFIMVMIFVNGVNFIVSHLN